MLGKRTQILQSTLPCHLDFQLCLGRSSSRDAEHPAETLNNRRRSGHFMPLARQRSSLPPNSGLCCHSHQDHFCCMLLPFTSCTLLHTGTLISLKQKQNETKFCNTLVTLYLPYAVCVFSG